MSAVSRLPFVAGTLSIGASAAALATIPSLRARVEAVVGASLVKTMLRALAVALALVNLKNLPFAWHWRVFRGILYQIYVQPGVRTPRTLFAPMITSSYNSLYDTDYNLHKSNSTYFADLDVARAHYVGSVVRTGLARLNAGDERGLSADTRAVRGRYMIALGAVGAFFHREIPPLARFEIHTRLLAWDRKWLYLVSHVVEPGVVLPESYALQPWRRSKGRARPADVSEDAWRTERRVAWKKHVYASSIARYVVKKGRLTINPEIVLERSLLLPRRPAGVGLPPRTEAVSTSVGATPATPATPMPAENGAARTADDPARVAAEVSSKLDGAESVPAGVEEPGWTWDDMEAERLRGLRIASHFDTLGGLHDEMRPGEALGEYSDWF